MRVNPISIATYRPHNSNRNCRATIPQQISNTSFHGWQGAVGATVGTAVGVGLGILTGGILPALIIGMAGCGVGGELGEAANNNKDDDDYSYDIPNKYD